MVSAIKQLFFLLSIGLHVIAYTPSKITILTGPLGDIIDYGHAGAKHSLIEGLRRIGVNFNVNPQSIKDIGDVVHIMAGDRMTLNQVIALKRRNYIKKIIVGPNCGEFCSAGSPYVYDSNIDAIITLADWVVEGFMLAYPNFDRTKIKQWFSGVDADFWLPDLQLKERSVLVYEKWQPQLADIVEATLRDHGWIPFRVSYGSYTLDQYKESLQQAQFAVFLSSSESQGIALAEAWAMDVPTIVWNCKRKHEYLGIKYPVTSACPFLTSATGLEWENMEEFTNYVAQVENLLPLFTPRDWVLEHMTDEVSAHALLTIISSLDNASDDVQRNYNDVVPRKPSLANLVYFPLEYCIERLLNAQLRRETKRQQLRAKNCRVARRLYGNCYPLTL